MPVRPWRQQNQILKATSIEGHVPDVVLVHNRAHRPIRRIDYRRTRRNGHDFGYCAQGQREIDRQSILHMQNDARLDECLKTDL